MRDHVGNILVVSADEEERCKRLHEAFFSQLQGWLAATMVTVRPSPGASRALAQALQETAAIVVSARTKIELPGETPGMVRRGDKWRDVELATIAFGYGITVTPIQMAGALAAIGNDGELRRPSSNPTRRPASARKRRPTRRSRY